MGKRRKFVDDLARSLSFDLRESLELGSLHLEFDSPITWPAATYIKTFSYLRRGTVATDSALYQKTQALSVLALYQVADDKCVFRALALPGEQEAMFEEYVFLDLALREIGLVMAENFVRLALNEFHGLSLKEKADLRKLFPFRPGKAGRRKNDKDSMRALKASGQLQLDSIEVARELYQGSQEIPSVRAVATRMLETKYAKHSFKFDTLVHALRKKWWGQHCEK